MRSSSTDPRLRPLAYVNADRAVLYRAVMGLFMEARERAVAARRRCLRVFDDAGEDA